MDNNLNQIEKAVFQQCGFNVTNFQLEIESRAYYACQFELNGRKVFSRNAKQTPKKIGQFVTFWKRDEDKPIEPFEETDQFDFLIVNVRNQQQLGQFVFPKSILLNKGIISTAKKEGKRAFRVYPNWDMPTSQQAKKTQEWQLPYFFEITAAIKFDNVMELYQLDK